MSQRVKKKSSKASLEENGFTLKKIEMRKLNVRSIRVVAQNDFEQRFS